MTARPDETPSWADDPDLENISVPNSAQRNTGWEFGQAPGSGVQNWWQQLAWKWLDYLQDSRVFVEINAFVALKQVVDVSGGTLAGAAYKPSARQYVFVGASGQISSNGTTGTGASDFTDETPDAVYADDFTCAVYDDVNNLFLIGGEDDQIQSSSGNGTWASRSDTGAPFYAAAVSDTGKSVFVGGSGSIKTSSNGTSFTSRTSAFPGVTIASVAWAPDYLGLGATEGYFAAITETGDLMYSLDGGVNWIPAATVGGPAGFAKIQFHENWGFIAHHDNTVKQSDTGSSWQSLAVGTISTVGISDSLLLPSCYVTVLSGSNYTGLEVWYGTDLAQSTKVDYAGESNPQERLFSLAGRVWSTGGDKIFVGGLVE